MGAGGSEGFGPVGASFLRKSRREGSSWSCPLELSPLPQSQPMVASEYVLVRVGAVSR